MKRKIVFYALEVIIILIIVIYLAITKFIPEQEALKGSSEKLWRNSNYETAIELQSYTIILTLITTLEKFSDLQVDTPDYENCCKIIGELVETYNLIMSKKGPVNIGKK